MKLYLARMQDSTRLEALLTWMEEEPVQGSIFFVVGIKHAHVTCPATCSASLWCCLWSSHLPACSCTCEMMFPCVLACSCSTARSARKLLITTAGTVGSTSTSYALCNTLQHDTNCWMYCTCIEAVLLSAGLRMCMSLAILLRTSHASIADGYVCVSSQLTQPCCNVGFVCGGSDCAIPRLYSGTGRRSSVRTASGLLAGLVGNSSWPNSRLHHWQVCCILAISASTAH